MLTHYEHRSKFYGHVERMINPGFITLTWQYQGTKVLLRSLYPSDYQFLQEQPESRAWSAMLLAASTYSINGRRFIDPEYKAFEDLVAWYQGLPVTVHQHLLMTVFTLSKRVKDTLRALEPFLYEHRSRELWRYVGSYPSPVCDEFLSIPGVSKYGPNTVQQLWTIWNRSEDMREQYQVQWGFTKAMLSGLSPKGVKAIDLKDTSKYKQEQRRRDVAQAKWLFDILGIRYQAGNDMFKPPEMKTFEDLQEEGRKWLAGEKDFHDLIVEDYRKRVTENRMRMVEQQQEHESLVSELEIPSGLVAYTPEELKGIVSGMSGIRKISEANPHVQEKWMSPAYSGSGE